MAKNSDVGLFQLANGNWGYRITRTQNGKRKDTSYHRDENGNPFKTKSAARIAREQKSWLNHKTYGILDSSHNQPCSYQ